MSLPPELSCFWNIKGSNSSCSELIQNSWWYVQIILLLITHGMFHYYSISDKKCRHSSWHTSIHTARNHNINKSPHPTKWQGDIISVFKENSKANVSFNALTKHQKKKKCWPFNQSFDICLQIITTTITFSHIDFFDLCHYILSTSWKEVTQLEVLCKLWCCLSKFNSLAQTFPGTF